MTAIGIAFVLFGLFVFFTCVVGLYRLDYVLGRMHAAALCDALGIFFEFVGVIYKKQGCKMAIITNEFCF